MPDNRPTFMTSYKVVYRRMACNTKGPRRRRSSERKTIVVNVSNAIAQCTLDWDGRVEFGARSMRR